MESSTTIGGLVEVGKRLVESVSPDTINVQVESLVERLVEVSPHGVAALLVHLLRGAEQVYRCGQDFHPNRELCLVGVQCGFDPHALVLELPEPCFDLGLGERVVAGEIEQPLLFGVQLLKLLLHAGVHLAHVGLLGSEAGIQHVPDVCLEPRGKFQRDVVVDNGLLDLLTREVGQIALAFLAPPAQEVAVAGANLAPCLGVDQA